MAELNYTGVRMNKEILLDFLKKQKDPIGTKELTELFETPERSMRRWLTQLVCEGIISKSGSTKNAKYALIKNVYSFDALRVIYRQERHAIAREVILQQLVDSSMLTFIDDALARTVAPADVAAVKEDTLEDLNRMDFISMTGLGITKEELSLWISRRDK